MMSSRQKRQDDGEDEEDLELMAQYDIVTSESEGDSETLHSYDSDREGDDDEEEEHEVTPEHYQAIRSTVIDISTALGGLEETTNEESGEVEKAYAIGHECLRCLRDLRTLLHQDEGDTARVIPLIFSEVNVVQRGLLPLLLKTAEMGERGSKIALACTDLITSLTWPIDIVAEQQAAFARDSDRSPLESFQRMQNVLVAYKSAILHLRSGETQGTKRSVLSVIMLHILLPAISKPRHRRNERDIGTISMCLHLFRNLLAIRDPLATSLSGSETLALSNLQNDLLVEMKENHILEALLMLANNAESRDFEPWNVVTAECVYHIYAGAHPDQLIPRVQASTSENQQPGARSVGSSALGKCLAEETRQRSFNILASGTSRHSRYGTAIHFKDDKGALRIARTQRALRKTTDQLTTIHKERKSRKAMRRKHLEEKGAAHSRATWSSAALAVVSEWADTFVKIGLESLMRSVVKDIRSESAKVGDIAQTRTRVMRLSHFFLEYFLIRQAFENGVDQHFEGDKEARPMSDWTFDLVGYWLEPWALKMAWMRANVAREDRQWLEFVTAVQLWTTLLRLVESLGRSNEQHHLDMAEGILAAHFYDELALDAAKSVIKSYTNQSFRCLETLIDFACVMPRALERYTKNKDNLYVKVKRQVRKEKEYDSATGSAQEEQEQIKQMVESQIRERKFEFQKFQSHLCSEQLVNACLLFLHRYREIDVEQFEERVGGVLHVLHRMAVKAENLRLFYPYERRLEFKKLEANQDFWLYVEARATKVHRDMMKLVKYVLGQFDKLDDDEKERWGEGMKVPKPVKVFKMPAEIEAHPDLVASTDRVRLAVTLLLEKDMLKAITWIKQGLEEAMRQKERISQLNMDSVSNDNDSDDEEVGRDEILPSDLQLEYHGDGMVREWASKSPEMKMLCRLLGMKSDEDDDHFWRWTIVASQSVEDHRESLDMIDDAMSAPFVSSDGEPIASCVRRRRKVQVRRQMVVNEFGEQEEVRVPRGRAPRRPRQGLFMDDDLIEDSDEEIEAAERMLAAQRERDEGQVVSARRSSSEEVSPLRDRMHGSSDRMSRSSSVTSSSVHNDSDGGRSSRTAKKGAALRRGAAVERNGLFLGSDDEDDNSTDEGDERETRKTIEQSTTMQEITNTARASKRPLHLGDSDADDEADDDNENRLNSPMKRNVPIASSHSSPSSVTHATQVRKRRALIVEDDDEEE